MPKYSPLGPPRRLALGLIMARNRGEEAEAAERRAALSRHLSAELRVGSGTRGVVRHPFAPAVPTAPPSLFG